MNEKTRQQMRDTPGLVDSLVGYIQGSLNDDSVNGKVSTHSSLYSALI